VSQRVTNASIKIKLFLDEPKEEKRRKGNKEVSNLKTEVLAEMTGGYR
jgi:hypothetical protein